MSSKKTSPTWVRRRSGRSGAGRGGGGAATPPTTAALLRSPRTVGGRAGRPTLPYRRLNSLEHHSCNVSAAASADPSWLTTIFAPNNYPRQAGTTPRVLVAEPAVVVVPSTKDDGEPIVAKSNRGIENPPGPATTSIVANSHNQKSSSSRSLLLQPSQPQQHQPRPFQEVALEKLHAILPQLVQHLSNATFQSAVDGTTLLQEASEAVAVATIPITTEEAASPSAMSHAGSMAASSSSLPIPATPSAASPPLLEHHAHSNPVNTSHASMDGSHSTSSYMGSPPNRATPLLQWLRTASSPKSSFRAERENSADVAGASSSSFPGVNVPSSQQHNPSRHQQRSRSNQQWDRLVQTPWTLLLVATVCAADMQPFLSMQSSYSFSSTQPQQHPQRQSLTALYQRCRLDLMEAERILCAATSSVVVTHHLHGDDDDGHDENDSNHPSPHSTMARSVQTTLQAVIKWISCQCQVLQQLYVLLDTTTTTSSSSNNSTTLLDVAAALRLVWHSLNNNNNKKEGAANVAKPLLRSLQRQVKAILAGLEASWALEQALFMESIVSLRQWQSQLFLKDVGNDHNDDKSGKNQTRINMWLRESYKRMVSVLPLYFDRAHTMAGPMYGFDTTTSTTTPSRKNNELNAAVMDFLKRQERLGGPPTAVAIVLDALGTSNLYPERGFRLSVDAGSSLSPDGPPMTGGIGANNVVTEQDDPRILWPAVFMRSSMHSGAAMTTSTTSSSTSNTPRNSSASLNRYGAAGNSPSMSRRKLAVTPLPITTTNITTTTTSPPVSAAVLEYGPEAGHGVAKTWPHSDWGTLANLLLREQQQRQDAAARAAIHSSLRGTTSPGIHLPQRKPHTVTYRGAEEESGAPLESISLGPEGVSSTTFHMVSLSEWITMVVLVKKEEETRWRKKRSQLSDEDIQEFLGGITAKLRVSNLFSLSNLPPSQLPKADSTIVKGVDEPVLSIPSGPDITWTDDKEVKEFLEHVLGALGLRTAVPSLSSSSMFGATARGLGPTLASAPGGSPSRGMVLEETAQTMDPSEVSSDTMTQSAAALFLGAELSQLLGGDL